MNESLSKKGTNLGKAWDAKSEAPMIQFRHLEPAVLKLDVDCDFLFYVFWVSVTCKQNGSGQCYQ